MPLSKKRNRERMKKARKTCVQPIEEAINRGTVGDCCVEKDDVFPPPLPAVELVQPKQPWEVTDWASYKGPIMPLPNCPDGRYRDV